VRCLAPVVLAALTTWVFPPTAHAQSSNSNTETARRLYTAANQAYAEGRYADAARAFREAHAISHRPELLYNIGIALAAAGDAQGAVEALSLFRDAGAPGFEDRADLDRQIAEQRALAARQQQATPSSAPSEVRIIERIERQVIEPRWFRVEARYERDPIHAVGPWIAVGLGTALAISSVVTGLIARDRAELLTAVNEGREHWSPVAADARTEGPTQATLALAFGIAGGALVTGGILWLFLRGPGRRVDVLLHSTAVPTSNGAVFSLGGAL
jgi:tetratricopeptide (TPR) repeat protein